MGNNGNVFIYFIHFYIYISIYVQAPTEESRRKIEQLCNEGNLTINGKVDVPQKKECEIVMIAKVCVVLLLLLFFILFFHCLTYFLLTLFDFFFLLTFF